MIDVKELNVKYKIKIRKYNRISIQKNKIIVAECN